MMAGSVLQAAFSRGRVREAKSAALAALFVVAIGVLLADSFWIAAPLALAVVGQVFVFTYVGGVSGRQALPAVMLGVLPLSTAILAGMMGHACTPSGCISLCAPFCTAGGVGAGFLLSRMTLSSEKPLTSWLSGAVLVTTTGAIGCACVGAGGILGMVTGLLISSGLWWIRSRYRIAA
jgi:hypothetical protein